MKVDDLKTLAGKLVEHIQKSKVEDYFLQFQQALTASLRNNRQQSVTVQKDNLFKALRSFDQLHFTYSEAHLFDILGYGDYVGKSAIQNIEVILYDENFDPQGVIQKIDAKQNRFRDFVAYNRNFQIALQRVPTIHDVALNEGEALLEITFTEKAVVDNIIDFEKWIDSWTKIIRVFSELVGEKPESSRIVFVQKSSPMIVDVATAFSLVLMVGKAVDLVLAKVERYLSIRKQIEEIKKLKLENIQIEKALEAEADAFSEKSAKEIASQLVQGINPKPAGDVVSGINHGIRNLFVFIDKGGRVDCPDSSEQEGTIDDVYANVRQLQKSVDKLKLIPEKSVVAKKSKKIEGD